MAIIGYTTSFLKSVAITSFLLQLDFVVIADGAACPEGFVLVPLVPRAAGKKISPRCYSLHTEKKSFQDAVEKCEKDGGFLASPVNKIHAESLARYILKNMPYVKRYWIGLTDQDTEGVFKWERDGSQLSTNFSAWMISEPESTVGAEPGSRADEQDCVKMAIWVYGRKTSARYYDTHCEKLESFVCERKIISTSEEASVGDDEEGSASSLPGEVDKTDNTSESDEKEVDFIVPKDVKNLLKNKGKEGNSTESTSTAADENVDGPPMELVAYGDEFDEVDATGKTDERKSLNATVKKSVITENVAPASKPDVRLKSAMGNGTRPGDRRKNGEQRACSLTCMPEYMRAACPMRYFPEIRHTRVVLNNATCRPRRNRTHLIVHIRLDDCGTTVQNTAKDNKVSFRNTIHLIPKGSGIIRNQKIAAVITEFMMLDCRYPQEHSVMHNFRPAEGKPQVYRTVEEGPPLEHLMLLYKSKQYDCPYAREDYPVQIPLSNRVYFEVTLDMPSERVELHPITCFATPDANPYNSNNYVMMQDGCIEDDTFRIEETDSRKVSRLSVEAFRFVGYFRKVFIHCQLLVCTINSESSPDCPYACNPEARYRRSADEKNDAGGDQNVITSHSGMIAIVDDNDVTDEEEREEEEGQKDGKPPVQSDSKQKAEPQPLQSQDTGGNEGGDGSSGVSLTGNRLLVMLLVLRMLLCQ